MTETVYVDTIAKAKECYHAVQASPSLLYFDTETSGLLVRSGTQDKARLIQVSVRPWDKAWAFDARDDQWLQALKNIFGAAGAICAHNTKFDIHVMETYGIHLLDMFAPRQIWDTLWLAHFFDETTSRRLKDLGQMYLHIDAGAEQAKLKRLMTKNNWDWDTVPIKYLVDYGGMDTLIGGELFDLLYPKVASWATEPLEREQALLPAIYAMERSGIRIDREGLAKMTQHSQQVQTQELERLAFIAGVDHAIAKSADGKDLEGEVLNLASRLQLTTLFRRLGAPIEDTQATTFYKMLYNTEVPQVARDAAQALLSFKAVTKTLTTYLRAWDRDITESGYIHPSFNTLGTITGRFSSSSPNFQNISKAGGLRDLMIPEDGHAFVVADYEQMELRLFAHFAQDEKMRAAFLSGDDIYQQVADTLGVNRSVGKMITLASQYGAGWQTTKRNAIQFAYKLGEAEQVPTLEAFDWREMIETFHSNYKVKWLQYQCEAMAQKRGQLGDAHIVTVGKRRQRPKRVKVTHNGRESIIPIFKDLSNSLIQGSCSDIMKDAIIDAHAAGLDLRLTVHDEVMAVVKIGEEENAIKVLTQAMERREYTPPLTVEAASGASYGEAK